MSRLKHRDHNRTLRKNRVKKATSHSSKLRLSVHVSNKHVSAQIIDDKKGATLAQTTSVKVAPKGSLTEKATLVGEDIAKKAASAKIKEVVLDRGHKKYHGRVKALSEAARKNGLEF